MPDVPPLTVLSIAVLARRPDHIPRFRPRLPASTALLNTPRDPALWATLAQLVHPLPPHLHEFDLPLSHPVLPILQKIPDAPDFALVTLVTLPNCTRIRDIDVANLRALHHLLALDLRGCAISSYAIITLARGLAVSHSVRTGTWGLRLLSLHGCPNIDDDVLSVLHKFPLLSVVDLRFTRCTPVAVNAHLSSLGFSPSHNSSLFHPAPLSLALCALDKVALTAPDPIPLYPCPPHSVFRIHVDQLSHLPSRPNKLVPVTDSSHLNIRTLSLGEDTLVFIPPLRKPSGSKSPTCSKLCVSTTIVPASCPTDQQTQPNPASNVSSFYENLPAHDKHSINILPLSAQAVQISKDGKLDSLAIARLPPSWKILHSYTSQKIATQQGTSCIVERSRSKEPLAHRMALDKPLKVDHARLHKQDSNPVADMVHLFSSKRLKVESEFAKVRVNAAVKPPNPFTRNAMSMFAKNTNVPDRPQSSARGSSREAESDMQLRTCHSLPCTRKVTWYPDTNVERVVKPLRPITTLKPPILPKELLSSISRPRARLKQTQLTFSREE